MAIHQQHRTGELTELLLHYKLGSKLNKISLQKISYTWCLGLNITTSATSERTTLKKHRHSMENKFLLQRGYKSTRLHAQGTGKDGPSIELYNAVIIMMIITTNNKLRLSLTKHFVHAN